MTVLLSVSRARQLAVCIAFISIFLATQSPAEAARKSTSWLSVPVFYATTRARIQKKDGYGEYRNLVRDGQGIEYGIVTVRIEVADTQPDKVAMVKLGWKQASKKERKTVDYDHLNDEDFYKALLSRHQSSPSRESCVFVHGYNNKFESAAKSAARLEVALKEPVVLFSWPSVGKAKAYVRDECNAEWSVRPFQVFMQGLEKKFDSENLMTVSHSMGNRLINWYFLSRYDRNEQNPPKFKEVVLTSPDIDRATFKNYFFKVAGNAAKTRIYISDKDLPLRLSKFVHGGARVGSTITKEENKWNMPGNIRSAQTVNFSTIDSGRLGHSIQYKVISSMHKSDQPGDGLVAEEDKTYKGNYILIRQTSK